MKNKTLGVAIVFAISALATLNVHLTESNNNTAFLALKKVHAWPWDADEGWDWDGEDDDDCDNYFFDCHTNYHERNSDEACEWQECFSLIVYTRCDTYFGTVQYCEDGGPDLCEGSWCG